MTDINQFVIDNEGLIYSYINQYCKYKADDDDFIQELRIALWKAAMNYDESKQASFSSYAFEIFNNTSIRNFNKRNQSNFKALNDALSLDRSLRVCDNQQPDVETFGDILPGKEHVIFDEDAFMKSLTPRQKAVYKLRTQGLTFRKMEPILGVSRQIIHKEIKQIKKKFKNNLITIGGEFN